MSLAAVLAGAETRQDGFALSIPPDWHQGRTAYGGFSAALALAAAMRVGEELPPLRSAQVSFVGPLAGDVAVSARKLRAGRNATWIAAEIAREGGVGLLASFVFMGPVPSALHISDRPVPSDLIAPDEAQAVPTELSPIFLRSHFDVRFAVPRSAEEQPELCWWVRLREREGIDPMVGLLACADGLPPGVLPLLDARSPVSSMTWQCNLLTPEPRTRDGWWLLRSHGDYAENGCSSQTMEIWNADGAPIMAGMQSVAVFG